MAQYNKATKELLSDSKTIYEVVMLADNDGRPTDYNSGVFVEFSGGTADAFGRGRVSQPQSIGDYKHTYDNIGDFLTSATNGGSVAYTTKHAAATLSTTSSANSRIVYQTKRYHHYLPGKSQLILSSFNFGVATPSTTKKIGYFDDLNGIYLESVTNSTGQTTLQWVIRSNTSGSAVNVAVAQSSWNQDRCNGIDSNFTIDPTKTQLIFIDFQWLGVGRVRCGFVHDGKLIVSHQFTHSNILQLPYWSNPNLPVRAEVQNLAANSGASMMQICSSVISEGGYIEAGTDWEIQNTTYVATATPGGTWTPILAVRLKNTFNGYPNRVLFSPENISIFADIKSVSYKIGKIPSAASLSGTLTWTDVNSGSASEYCTNATGITMANFSSYGGGFLSSGVSSGAQSASSPSKLTESRRNIITQNYASTDSEVFVVVAKTLSTATNDQANVWASAQWKEII